MNAYRLAALPGNAAVSSFFTLVVAAWFLVAAGAILADARTPVGAHAAVASSACASPAATATSLAAAPTPARRA